MKDSKPHCLSESHNQAVRAYVVVDGRPVLVAAARTDERRKPLIPLRSRKRKRKRRRLTWGGAVAMLVMTAAAATMLHWSDAESGTRPPLARMLTGYPGEEIHPAFSAVGGRVAFAWRPPGERSFRIYTQGLADSRPVSLTRGVADEASPVFSPDGASVAYLRYSDPQHADVMVTTAAGGAERNLCGIAVDPLERALDWAPDGRWLVAADRKHLTLISPDTGEKRRLTYPEDGVEDFEPSFAPDAGSVLFVRLQQGLAHIARQPLTATGAPDDDPKIIEFPGFAQAILRCPRWLPGGQEIVFVANRDGADKIWSAKLASTSAGVPEAMYAGAAGSLVTDLAVARQGRKLVFSQNIPSREICRLAIPGKEILRMDGSAGQQPLFSAAGEQTNPQYSPDGKSVVFESNQTGKHELWLAGSDGRNSAPLDDIHPMEAGSPRWSPNGQTLVFETRATRKPQVWSISAMASGRPHCLTPGSDGRNPDWSADGAAVYFSSNRSGRPEIWRTPTGGGQATQITHGGGLAAVGSSDGKFIYYQREPGRSPLWRMPLDGGGGGGPIRIAEAVVARGFSAAPAGVYFLAEKGSGTAELWLWDSRTSKAYLISTVPGVGSEGLSVSPNGRFLLFSTLRSPSADLMILDGLAALR